MRPDLYVRGFANGMARLCHRGGTTLPSHWQNFATMMAKKQEKTN
ncbi:hypothetical protein [Bacteroides muris (ex Fokt et al. 2023)]|nr:hypothetical protein [Bacteroides muris (ex Fokt et al. 2023)]